MTWAFHWVKWQEDAFLVDGEITPRAWLASLVEKNIVAQAKTLEDLDYELKRILAIRVIAHGELGLPGDPFERIAAPPDYVFDWADGEPEPLTLTLEGTCLRFHDGDCFTFTEA